MFDWFPTWVFLCFAVILAAVVFSLAVILLIRRYVHIDYLRRHHDLAGFLIGTLGTLYSVLLGFTIVNSQDRYVDIISHVNKEAFLCADLYRMSSVFPMQIQQQIQQAVLAYLHSVVVDEWPLMQEKKESPITLKTLEELWTPYQTFEPTTEQEKLWLRQSLQVLYDFNSARLERIYSSWDSLGKLSWAALIMGGLFLVIFLFFFGHENLWVQFAINTIFIVYFVFTMYVVYSLDHPFKQPEAIEPRAYEVIYSYYNNTRGKPISPEDPRILKNITR